MRYAVFVPWLLTVLVAVPPIAATLRSLPDRLDPRPVLFLITASLAGLAVATTGSLAVLVVAGAAALAHSGPLVAPDGHADPTALPAGAVSVLVLTLVLVRVARTVHARRCRRLTVRAALRDAAEIDGVVLVDDVDAFAVATPPDRHGPGRVIVSRGLWEVLDGPQRAAVVAHERAHLDGAHHRHLAVAAVAVALNPLLAAWWRELVYSAERCADEGAARRVADRRLVARAVGRAALVARGRPVGRALPEGAFTLGATTGPVPRRVAALLAGRDSARLPAGLRAHLAPGLVAASTLITLVALAAVGAVHAAWDLHELLGSSLS